MQVKYKLNLQDDQALEQAHPQHNSLDIEHARVHKVFGQCSHMYCLNFGWSCGSHELGLKILMDPFQLWYSLK